MYLLSRTTSFAKLFFLISFCGLLMYVGLAFYTFQIALTSANFSEKTQQSIKLSPTPIIKARRTPPKSILIWTTPEFPYNLRSFGREIFIDNDCRHTNCILSTNKTLLGNVTKFDAIIFSYNSLRKWNKFMPKSRSPMQKYIFYSMMPANEFPICNVKADWYFNWTWTYKLYSDIPTPFIEVRDLGRFNDVIAPKLEVDWIDEEMYTVNKTRVRPNKKKIIIWINDKCDEPHQKIYAKELKKLLQESGHDLDIFGCEFKKCPEDGCAKLIEHYYFYMVYEKTLAEDYMTTDVLNAFDHNTVPVLISGADHNKFLPPVSYIDGRYETPEGLASLLIYVSQNNAIYNKYFNWRNHYTIKAANIQKGYCEICSLLHDQLRVETQSAYENFRKWWYYGDLREKCFPKGAERYDEVLSYIEDANARKTYMP